MRRRDQAEDAAVGVVAGDATGEGDVAAEPVEVRVAEVGHVVVGVVSAEQGAGGGQQDVAQRVLAGAREARVWNEGEATDQPVREGDGGPRRFFREKTCIHIYK